MARVIICDDDQAVADELAAALRALNHDATASIHTMDVLRDAADGCFDLVAFGLDRAGFSSEQAIDAMRELAPHVSVIGFHRQPAEFLGVAANPRLSAVLPRPVSVTVFLYAVARALAAQPLNNSLATPGV
jgi:DNA-binding NtrC family response regulator